MKNKKSTSQRKTIKQATKSQPKKQVTKSQPKKEVTKNESNKKIKLAIRIVEYEKQVKKEFINNKKVKQTIKKQAPIKSVSKRNVRIVTGYSVKGQKFTSKFFRVKSIKEYEKIFNSIKKNKKAGSNLTLITFEYTERINLKRGIVSGQKCVTRKLIKKRKNKKDKLNDSIVSNFIEVAQNLSFLNEQYELEYPSLDYFIEHI